MINNFQYSKNEKKALLVNEILLILLALIMIYPLINTLAVSFSSSASAEAGRVFLIPVDFQWKGWEYVVTAKSLHRSIINSLYITILGTFLSLAFTALFAYPLSKSYFKLRKFLSFIVIFTMIFRYPLIPYFLTIRSYGLMNNIHVLIITHLITPYNMIIMRTFFQNIPLEMEEAAFLEGASPLRILIQIYLPLSKAVFATLGLFFAVLYWNLFLHPLLFLQDPATMPIQVQLRQFIALSENMDESMLRGVITENMDINRTTIKAAVIIFGTLPIIMVYPFLQKHFVKGALLGSVKG